MKNMEKIIIVGLGNPGNKYRNTRHNIGFRIVDEFAKENNFPKFKLSKKFNSLTSENIFNDKKVILAKPQTFMNQSGKAAASLISFYKIEGLNFIVFHDDIDLLLGKFKIVKNRGSAGHKGVESIIKKIGNKDFTRFRIGVQPKKGKPKNAEKFVLQKFTKAEEKAIEKVIKAISKTTEFLITEGLEKTMNQCNA